MGETLLIVDDDEFMRELLTGAFSEDGYEVVSEPDGERGLSALNHREFNVALIDLSLPDGNGLQLLKSISEGSPETEIIIMTGYPSIDSAIEAMRHGARDYVIKPFRLPEVKGAVERALRTRKIESEVRQLRQRVRELEEENRQLRPAADGGRPQPARRAARLPGAYGTQVRRPAGPEVEPHEPHGGDGASGE